MTDMLTASPPSFAPAAVDQITAGAGLAGVDEIDEPLVCKRITDITHDVKSFSFEPAQPLRFHPGQYLTVTVDVDGDGDRLQRCYTISSPPTRPELLTITVKRVPGGPVSNWLHDHLTVGDVIGATGPFGRFGIADHRAPKYLFLSAGSGITPLMSITRALHDWAEPTDLVFVHSARTPQDIIFRRELDTLGTRQGFSVAAVCSSGPATESWLGASGRLSLPILRSLAPDLHEREIFTCGPPAYMQAVREMLATAGVDPQRCHEESFDVTAHAPPRSDRTGQDVPAAGQRFAVEFRRSRRTVECDVNETVLDAALRNGLKPPSMCTEGMCGTCKTTLLGGYVDMVHAGGIRPREIDQGKILICCSTPLDDLVIDA